MADSKITALDNLTSADPANDMIPIVDVSATPPASGNTKRISINNLLACSPSATLASATITGDLTAQNNIYVPGNVSKKIGPVGSTWGGLRFDSTNQPFLDSDIGITFRTGGSTSFTTSYVIGATGVSTWSVGGSTAMTLNSTGLGIGTATINERLVVQTALTGTTAGSNVVGRFQSNGSGYDSHIALGDNVNPSGRIGYLSGALYLWTNGASRLNIDTSGNVGIGVASPTSQLTVGSGGTANPAATVAFHKSTSDEYRLKLTSSTFNAAGKWIGLGLGYSSDYMKMAIIAEAKDTNARGNLYFALNGDATSANASIADAKMTLKSTGQVRFVPLAADPAGAEAGDVYYNSTSNKLKCYNGTTWNDLF